jgi:hypothetical protein
LALPPLTSSRASRRDSRPSPRTSPSSSNKQAPRRHRTASPRSPAGCCLLCVLEAVELCELALELMSQFGTGRKLWAGHPSRGESPSQSSHTAASAPLPSRCALSIPSAYTSSLSPRSPNLATTPCWGTDAPQNLPTALASASASTSTSSMPGYPVPLSGWQSAHHTTFWCRHACRAV